MKELTANDFLITQSTNKQKKSEQRISQKAYERGLLIGSESGKIEIDCDDNLKVKTNKNKLRIESLKKEYNFSELIKGLIDSGAHIMLYRKEQEKIAQYMLQSGHYSVFLNKQQQIHGEISSEYKNVFLLKPLKVLSLEKQINKIMKGYDLTNKHIPTNILKESKENKGVLYHKETDTAFVYSNVDLMNMDINDHFKELIGYDALIVHEENLQKIDEKNKKSTLIEGHKYYYSVNSNTAPTIVIIRKDKDAKKIKENYLSKMKCQ